VQRHQRRAPVGPSPEVGIKRNARKLALQVLRVLFTVNRVVQHGVTVAFAELFGDFGVHVGVGVFGFPVTQRHAQLVQQRPVNRNIGFGGGFKRVFGQKDQALLLASGLEQVLQSLTNNGFPSAATGTFYDVKLLEIVINQQLAHGVPCFGDFSVRADQHQGSETDAAIAAQR
jgi:hypothetical protein